MAFHNVPPNGFPDLPDMEEVEAVVKDVTNLKTSVSGLSEDVSDLSDNKANQITIAPFFNPETAYEVGDLVYYNGLSYRCTNAHEGEWDADDFAATTIANELSSLESGLTNVETGLNGNVVNITTGVKLYKQGKFRMLVVYGATSPSDGVIANIPSSDSPRSQFVYPAMFMENNTPKSGYLQINADGNVYIRSLDDVLKDNCPVYGSYCYHII